MSKLIRLWESTARYLNPEQPKERSGYLTNFLFLKPEENKTESWGLAQWGDALKALPEKFQHHAKTFEYTATTNTLAMGVWTTDRDSNQQIENHFKTFNPAMKDLKPENWFPHLPPGAWVRVGRVKLQRCARYPLETKFGSGSKLGDDAGRISPLVHVLNTIPYPVPDGVTLFLQFIWRKSRYWWKFNPMTRFEWPWMGWLRGRNAELLEEKSRHRDTWYLDIRILEVHTTKETTTKRNYGKLIGTSFGAWKRQQGNTFQYDSLRPWGRHRIKRFIKAMKERDIDKYQVRFSKRAWLVKDELASVVHPLPPGTYLPSMLYTSIKMDSATAHQKNQAYALKRMLQQMAQERENKEPPKPKGIMGSPRRMSAADTIKSLKDSGMLDKVLRGEL